MIPPAVGGATWTDHSVSRYVANFFTPSLYAVAIKNKGIPILPAKAPKESRDIEVCEIMSEGSVLSVPTLCSVK